MVASNGMYSVGGRNSGIFPIPVRQVVINCKAEDYNVHGSWLQFNRSSV